MATVTGAWLPLSPGRLWQRVALQRDSACPPGTKDTSVQPSGGYSQVQPLQPAATAKTGQPASTLALSYTETYASPLASSVLPVASVSTLPSYAQTYSPTSALDMGKTRPVREQAQAVTLKASPKPTHLPLSDCSLCFLGPSYPSYEAAVLSAAGPQCPPPLPLQLPPPPQQPLPLPTPPGSLWGGPGGSPSASSAGSLSGKLLAPPKLPKPRGGPKEPPLHYCDICKISCAGPQVSCPPPLLSRPRGPSWGPCYPPWAGRAPCPTWLTRHQGHCLPQKACY